MGFCLPFGLNHGVSTSPFMDLCVEFAVSLVVTSIVLSLLQIIDQSLFGLALTC